MGCHSRRDWRGFVACQVVVWEREEDGRHLHAEGNASREVSRGKEGHGLG